MPVLSTEQIRAALHALGVPEPEMLPRATALGALLFWAESCAAAADRIELEEIREAFILDMDAALGIDPASPEAQAEKAPASRAPWWTWMPPASTGVTPRPRCRRPTTSLPRRRP